MGFPRATIDLDLLVLSDEVARISGVLGDLGYRLRGADMTFAAGAVVISRLVKPDPDSEDVLMVDLLHVTGALRPVWEGRQRLAWEHGNITTVSRDVPVEVDLSPKAVTARLKRMSQLRALCLSLAAAGRRAGLHDRPAAHLDRPAGPARLRGRDDSSGEPAAAE